MKDNIGTKHDLHSSVDVNIKAKNFFLAFVKHELLYKHSLRSLRISTEPVLLCFLRFTNYFSIFFFISFCVPYIIIQYRLLYKIPEIKQESVKSRFLQFSFHFLSYS